MSAHGARYSLHHGVATVHSSGDLSSLADMSDVQRLVIAKTDETPEGDPVIVHVQGAFSHQTVLPSLLIQKGATAHIGGGPFGLEMVNNLNVDGGALEIAGDFMDGQPFSQINVGPNGGAIRLAERGFSLSAFAGPIRFVDAHGRVTNHIPKNFVMDFLETPEISTVYDPRNNTTIVGDGQRQDARTFERQLSVKGDPFNLKNTGGYLRQDRIYAKSFTPLDARDDVLTCFLPGVMIETPNGDVAVETLQIGDGVTTYENGQRHERPIVWIGKRNVTVRTELFDDEAGYPVRVLKDALAPGLPHKDLLITSEHCVVFDEKFIPIRMLVNNKSIFYDRSIVHYTYYHIETDEHAIIRADGVLSESYLDTGNRASFRDAASHSNIVQLFAQPKSWQTDAAATLTVERAVVEPIFRQIEERAEAMNLLAVASGQELTDDSDLHLLTETGRVLRKTREANGRAMFMVPSDVRAVKIISRTSRPSRTIGPFVDDRRELGVLVGTISLFDSNITRIIDAHLKQEAVPGWSRPDGKTQRWTTGCAELPLGERQPGSIGLLAIEILAGGPYFVKTDVEGQETPITA
ncbi:Hint domain-containing protein [Kozakia baliensis]|uniref:Uncharacterized protein n=1 Tax=Kozakia baliensis TaxID=153496 RepID=A0A1D8UVB2_9PROT|nr:Hint domain-containing protein [Kozakia baliensis]AOX17584.1 hypothetical protein A0U89_11000 [Kozakia baliensis]GBR31073.1 outer membrane protein [Kozakia baliensis NRIC 0488]GEL62935.1 hypothetical protein KBA01_02210 [Kozakia baliensis]